MSNAKDEYNCLDEHPLPKYLTLQMHPKKELEVPGKRVAFGESEKGGRGEENESQSTPKIAEIAEYGVRLQ